MTVTDIATDTGVSVVPTFTMPASQLRDMLTGAVVATSKDKYSPILTGVRFSWSDGGAVEVAATDRYRLARGVSDTNGAGDGGFLLERKSAIELAKALPKRGKVGPDADVTVTVTAQHVTFFTYYFGDTLSREYRTLDGEFPKYHSLIPSDDMLTGSIPDGFSCNPVYLADVAKLPHGKNAPVTWRFSESTRPAVATYPSHNGVTWTYLLMPVRITR